MNSRNFITSTELTGLRPMISAENEVFWLYEQFKKVFAENQEYLFFAEPVLERQSQEQDVQWYTEYLGDAISYSDLGPEEQRKVRGELYYQLHRLTASFQELPQDQQQRLQQNFDSSIEIPDLKHLYWVNGKLVVVCWGFLLDEINPPRKLLEKLMQISMNFQVKNEAGKPLPNISIEFFHQNQTSQIRTDQEGKTFLIQIPLGTQVNVKIAQQKNFLSLEESFSFEDDQVNLLILKEEEEIIPIVHEEIKEEVKEEEKSKKKKILLWGSLLLFLLLGIVAGWFFYTQLEEEENEEETPFVIKIIDGETGIKVQEAEIQIKRNNTTESEYSDLSGDVNLMNFPDGESFTYVVTAFGYAKKEGEVNCCQANQEIQLLKPALPCGVNAAAGGNEIHLRQYKMGKNQGEFDLTYNMHSQPDELQIKYEGKIIAQTSGEVSGSKTMRVNFQGGNDVIEVKVIGNTEGTKWSYQIGCPLD